MRRLFLHAAVALATVLPAAAQSFIAHEWGTFTTLQGSDGTMLHGLFLEEEHLPPFVHCHSGISPDLSAVSKGSFLSIDYVSVKMETPVVYFYSPTALDVNVRIDFPRGSISQWYPQRHAGESQYTGRTSMKDPYNGWVEWNARVLPPDTVAKTTGYVKYETPSWVAPRATDANLVMGNDKEIEKYLFYRGVGNFEMPLKVSITDAGELRMMNVGDLGIPYLLVYEKPVDGPARVWWTGALGAGQMREVPPSPVSADLSTPFREFQDALEAAGLYRKEAAAMLETWHKSYFGTPGLRVFWVVPRAMTDDILPMKITPAPERTERVLVGRSEVLTPAFEKEIADDYENKRMGKWDGDRYHVAYLERARQISGTSSVALDPTGVASGIELFPNPTTGALRVRAAVGHARPVQVTVTSVAGAEMLRHQGRSLSSLYSEELNVSALPAGCYVVTVQAGELRWSTRVIRD